MRQVVCEAVELEKQDAVPEMLLHRAFQVLARIEANPSQYNQNRYGGVSDGTLNLTEHIVNDGMACCFAGHAVAMFADAHTQNSGVRHLVSDEAIRLLGVPNWMEEEFRVLFQSPDRWPKEFKDGDHVTPAGLRRRFEHFVATGSMTPVNARY